MDSDQAINFRDTNNKIYSSVANKLNLDSANQYISDTLRIAENAPTVHISDTLRKLC